MTWKTLAAVALGLGLVGAVGCDGKKDAGAPKAAGNKKEGEHHGDHGAGPHGGTIFDIAGGKYHGEFKPDHQAKSATVWILGADEKTPAPVKADKLRLVVTNTTPRIEIDLLPTDARDGSASTFSGTSDGFKSLPASSWPPGAGNLGPPSATLRARPTPRPVSFLVRRASRSARGFDWAGERFRPPRW